MTYQPTQFSNDPMTLPKMPSWVTSGVGESPANVAFLSGASFAMLDVLLRQSGDAVPVKLLANTLALKAAVATSKLEGRLAREPDIRDSYHLTPPDADGVRHWGPDGDVLDFWRNAVRLRLTGSDWTEAVARHVSDPLGEAVGDWLADAIDQGKARGPLAAASGVLRSVLEADDRAEREACLLADIILGRFFGWGHPLPLSALHLTKATLRDLRDGAGEADLAVHQATTQSAQSTLRMASVLASRAAVLRSVAPKLRAKGSDDAVALFLTEDAVAPSGMLSPTIQGTRTPMTGRAARRLCDRLVELGVIKELTGRATFRLYGIAP